MASPGRAPSRPSLRHPTPAAPSPSSSDPMRAYSFAQQMPHLPSSRSSRLPHPTFPAPAKPSPVWPTRATAAEVVAGAAKPSAEPAADGSPDDDVDHRHQAELALYSKLVPTTSAVPRNPGRTLGGGRLRATGSVAAQKTRAAPNNTPLAPAPTHPRPREPMASRMRSLSSEASKPQLARRVAKPSRTPTATPPPVANELAPAADESPVLYVEESVLESAGSVGKVEPGRLEQGTKSDNPGRDDGIATPKPRELLAGNEDAYLKSIRSIYGNVERETTRPISRNESSGTSGTRKSSGDEPTPPRPSSHPSRRLNEAFKSPSPPPSARYDDKRSPSPVPSRKDQIGALRRSSALSPPPGLPRKGSGRESAATPVKNGRKTNGHESLTDVPPGFEAKTATMSRGAFLGRRGKTDENPLTPKSGEREREPAPARPQNARAHAFREAINTRRQSSSPRPPSSSRRSSAVEANSDLSHESSGNRNSLPRDGSRLRNGDREMRNLSFPAKNQSAPKTTSHEGGRSRRGSDISLSNLKRDEKIMQRRLEKPAAVSTATLVPTDDTRTSRAERTLPTTNRTDFIANGSSEDSMHVEKKQINMKLDNGRFKSPVAEEGYIFAATASDESMQIHPPKVVSYPDEHQEMPMRTSPLAGHDMNGWSNGTNGVNDEDAEAFVRHLLEQEEDDFVPITSAPVSTRPATTGGPSMIDLMRHLHANSATSSVLSNSGRNEEVLPPLPNSEEDVRFETMLRSMGWTPPEEDETPETHENGVAVSIRPATSRGVRVGVPDIGLSTGLRKAENGSIQSPYYSHFQ